MSALEPLLGKRRADRQAAEHALARAAAAHRDAAEALLAAQTALAEHTARAPERPAGGVTNGLAIARTAAYAKRHAERAAQLKQTVKAAEAQLAQRAGALEAAQRSLAQRSADERAVAQRLERAEHDAARARQRRDQEALDEQAAARIFARKDPGL